MSPGTGVNPSCFKHFLHSNEIGSKLVYYKSVSCKFAGPEYVCLLLLHLSCQAKNKK